MTTVTIKLSQEAEALVRRLGDSPALFQVIARTMDYQNELTVGHIQTRRLGYPRNAPPTLEGLRHISGELQKSLWRTRARVAGNAVVSSIGTNVRYAAIHEFGGKTAPHVIRPRNARALSFMVGGRKVTVQKVNHPGSEMPARAPIRRGIEDRKDAYGEALSNAVIHFYAHGT